MCGICCVLPYGVQTSNQDVTLEKSLLAILTNRGPDLQHQATIEGGITFIGCVLWQQGKYPTKQPLESDTYILLFNGDIFNTSKHDDQSDTLWLLTQLDKCKSEKDMMELLKTLQGPYSLIIYNKKTKYLYFMRDPLGRNSLILERQLNSIRILSSSYVSKNTKTIEVPAVGIFKINSSLSVCTLFPWNEECNEQLEILTTFSNLLGIETKLGSNVALHWSSAVRREPLYNFSTILENITSTADETFQLFEKILSDGNVLKTVEQVTNLLRASVEDRARTTPEYCTNCIKLLYKKDIARNCRHAKLAILFSGGIDCTILAAIANSFVASADPIDLINVAFEPANKNASSVEGYNVPDRLSAIESLRELEVLFPERQWNLVEVNINRDELQHKLKDHICHLIYPLNTVLDESLGCAFWFASHGQGRIGNDQYTSSCRVILVGSGADELFGGYIRHRNAFNRYKGNTTEKIKALENELNLDWKRIPSRNLGRDDRIIADNGRTSRAPFIEENLVQFVTNLHALELSSYDLDQGVGDKLLLRLVGYNLGLRNVTQFKKRAIQFGSRIADKNQNAKDKSIYLS